jgi:hypothetical protein
MDGSLTLESALGVGSEFTFEFPAERVADAGRVLPFAGRTALIVGDEDAVCRTIAGALADLGITVETAPDGYLGLALAERWRRSAARSTWFWCAASWPACPPRSSSSACTPRRLAAAPS